MGDWRFSLFANGNRGSLLAETDVVGLPPNTAGQTARCRENLDEKSVETFGK